MSEHVTKLRERGLVIFQLPWRVVFGHKILSLSETLFGGSVGEILREGPDRGRGGGPPPLRQPLKALLEKPKSPQNTF